MLASANTTRFLFDCPAQRQDWRVIGFIVDQKLSSPGECELELACPKLDLDASSLIGKAAVLTLFDTEHPTFFHGEIAAASQGKIGKRFGTYDVTLRPKLYQLSFRSGLRIFQNKSVPDIVQQVLKEAGISGKDVRLELTASYPPRNYCTQYRESDLAFVQRLLAEEGLFYFFDHSVERHTLVISDNKTSFKPIAGNATLPYTPAAGMVTSEQSVVEFQAQAQLATGAATLRDFFFEKPNRQLQADAPAKRFAMLEQYDYPGGFTDSSAGSKYAQVRHQAHQATSQIMSGRSDSQRLQCGRRFTLGKHPRKDFNADYTLTQIYIRGRQPQVLEEGASGEGSSFSLEFRAIPAATDFRPLAGSSKPRIEGVQTAFVTGPKGEEIYTDAHGRIKVQFHWDREGKRDQNSSCWLRVAQAWAGNQWGSLMLPRIGQEVLVTFLDGDPDRPLVTGSLYNAATQPPYDLPANKTRTTFKSQSTPGGGGFNELRIEDKKGSEQLFAHAEKDANLFVKNDWQQTVDHDTHRIVQKNGFENIGKDIHLNVAGHRHIKTGKTLSENVGADAQIKAGANYLLQAGRELHWKGGQSVVLDAGMSITLKAGGGTVVLDPSGVSITGSKVRINSGGGAGSAKAASPVAPKNPAAVDPGKPGGKIAPGWSNAVHQVEKIPFGTGAAGKPVLKDASVKAGSGAASAAGVSPAKAAGVAGGPASGSSGGAISSALTAAGSTLAGLPSTAKLVAGSPAVKANSLAGLMPDGAKMPTLDSLASKGKSITSDVMGAIADKGAELKQKAGELQDKAKSESQKLIEKGEALLDDAQTQLSQALDSVLPDDLLATLAAIDPTGKLAELLENDDSYFSE